MLLLVSIHTRVSVHAEENSAKCIPRKGAEYFYNNLGDRMQQGQIGHKDTEAKIFVTKFQKWNKFRRSIKNCKLFKLKPKKHLMSCKETQNILSEQRFS